MKCSNCFNELKSCSNAKRNKNNFCSRKCYAEYITGKKHSEEHNKKITKSAKIGVENKFWRGDAASYPSKHKRIYRLLGKAIRCEVCGIDKVPNGKKRYFTWSNIDHKYSYKKEDYKQMCLKCHWEYDKKNNNRKIPKRDIKTGLWKRKLT